MSQHNDERTYQIMPEHGPCGVRNAASVRAACDAFWERRGVRKKSMGELRDDWFAKKKKKKKEN